MTHGFPKPQREHQFAEVVGRKFRFDLCWPNTPIPALNGRLLAFEIDGGGPKGRHMTMQGFEDDLVKCNLAVLLGWCVFRFTPQMLARHEHLKVLAELWPTTARAPLSGVSEGVLDLARKRTRRRRSSRTKPSTRELEQLVQVAHERASRTRQTVRTAV